MFISTFLDQDFMNRYNLFVSGKRLNKERMVWEYTIKSRKLEDYKNMIQASLYHPPHITVDQGKTKEGTLYLMHHFEEKPLLKEFIANTMLGIEYLWGGPVKLETSEAIPVVSEEKAKDLASYYLPQKEEAHEPEIVWRRVLYTMENRKLNRKEI
jgi:stage V sporulation protein R